MMRLAVALVVLAAAALLGWRSADTHPDPCRELVVSDARYLVCTLPRADYRVSVGSNTPADGVARRDGRRRPPTVMDHLRRMQDDGLAPLLVMNGGMYHADLSPVGLLVENGRESSPLNDQSGSGNFFLKPNGVFWVDAEGRAVVSTTDQYVSARPRPRYATQSGPMLVSGGRDHPALQPNGASRHIRNGVGVAGNGDVVLVISRTPVSLGVFARLFRETLGCPDALYLDGSVSALAGPDGLRAGTRRPAGPVIRVERALSERSGEGRARGVRHDA